MFFIKTIPSRFLKHFQKENPICLSTFNNVVLLVAMVNNKEGLRIMIEFTIIQLVLQHQFKNKKKGFFFF